MLIFIVSFTLTIITAFIQTANWTFFSATLKPDLILVVLIILALVNPNWIKRAILILTAALILKVSPGITFPDLIFVTAAVASIILMDFLPWRQPANLIPAVSLGTLIINFDRLTLSPLIYELIFNLSLALVLFVLLKLANVPQIELQRNRL